ncbi:hypothetical protein MEQU1_001222 [Malassezia equina]|uniref:Uncharacterized protein n=1 Tax=Malassezia equina TaxID=1381935 RepID=A0AAF0EDH2_9BASI|nr:hypothetical protein MEQU1_001222 [Malassezia equina]
MATVRPTRTLAPRSVPISTLPPVSLRLPKELADVDMSLFYMGQGFQSQTTVYAMITGHPNAGDGPKTHYMYQDQTAVQFNRLDMATNVRGQSLSGMFDMGCERAKASKKWVCSYGVETSDSTSMYTTFTTPMQPVTTFTPVQGLLQSLRQATASGPAPPPPGATTPSNAGHSVLACPGPFFLALCTLLLSAGAFLL